MGWRLMHVRLQKGNVCAPSGEVRPFCPILQKRRFSLSLQQYMKGSFFMPKIPMPAQIRRLYLHTGLNAVQLASASWVALLAARGYSLVEIGLAESAFHLTSLLFEIPSGVMSDVFGRKRVLLLSQACSLISALLMLLSRSLTDIMIAMIFCALGYNFASGTREALAYDSLETAGRAAEYDRYAAADMGIYRVVNACATLGAGLALTLGYRRAYASDILLGLLAFAVTLRLRDAAAQQVHPPARQRMTACLRESMRFLSQSRQALRLISINAIVGAGATLLRFFLQARLTQYGMPDALLGPALFIMGLGGALGARCAAWLRGWPYRRVWRLTALITLVCLLLSLRHALWLMCLCGFAAAVMDDWLEVRTDAALNALVPSAQRATLISVSSLCFSLVMLILSPLMGHVFSIL